MPSSGCPRRGKLGSWHRIPLGLGWGRGCPRIRVPAGLPWRWMGQSVGLSPIQDHLPGLWKPPGPGTFPQRDPGTDPGMVPGPCGAANTRCLSSVPQGNDVLEDEDASPTQEDGKRPGSLLSPCFQIRCHRWAAERVADAVLAPAPLPAGCHRGEPWVTLGTGAGKASVTAGPPMGGLNTSGWGEASRPRGPR